MTLRRVLSVNTFVMGHASYQLGLERAFATHLPAIDFESVHLPDVSRQDLMGRIAWHLLTPRLPAVCGGAWDFHRLRSEVASSLFLRRWLGPRLRAGRPDVLHVHTQSIALLAGDLLRSMPSVVSLDCTSAILARRHPHPAPRTYRPIVRLERACLRAATRIVCWSSFARASVIDDYGIEPARVSVVRPAVATRRLPPRSPRRGSRLRLLFVGNDFYRKGGHDLVEVYRAHLRSSCELDVVSNGVAELPRLERLRLHRGLGANAPALLQLYADADAFVMPTYEDAFGIVYVEAMAAGLPCIGSDVLAVPELVQDGVTGITVRPGDRAALRAAIERLRDDEPWRHRLAQAGLEFARRECDDAANTHALTAVFEAAHAEHSTSNRSLACA
jgi:glycosyltransferase involved in cell wall biosynthesis